MVELMVLGVAGSVYWGVGVAGCAYWVRVWLAVCFEVQVCLDGFFFVMIPSSLSLLGHVQQDTKGDYQKALLYLCGGDD